MNHDRDSPTYKRLDEETSIWWCAECGAVYSVPTDTCALRFGALLALDFTRREPWGSRHGQAFAAFALQHPKRYDPSLDRAWAALIRIYEEGDRPEFVFARLRAVSRGLPPEWNVRPRPASPLVAPRFTIVDLGEFSDDAYPQHLDAWCKAALGMWGYELS